MGNEAITALNALNGPKDLDKAVELVGSHAFLSRQI